MLSNLYLLKFKHHSFNLDMLKHNIQTFNTRSIQSLTRLESTYAHKFKQSNTQSPFLFHISNIQFDISLHSLRKIYHYISTFTQTLVLIKIITKSLSLNIAFQTLFPFRKKYNNQINFI